jgi:hypothetical protein
MRRAITTALAGEEKTQGKRPQHSAKTTR